jgi:hypothetical protein
MEASCNEVVPTKSGDLWRLTSHLLIMSQSREMWRLSSGGSRGVRPGGGTRTGGSRAGAGTTEQLGDTGTIPSGGAWNSWHSVHANSKGGRKAAPATRPRRIGATVGSSSTRRGSPQRDSAGERSAGPTQSRGLEGSRSSPKSVPRIWQDLRPDSKPRGGAGDETRTRDIQLKHKAAPSSPGDGADRRAACRPCSVAVVEGNLPVDVLASPPPASAEYTACKMAF